MARGLEFEIKKEEVFITALINSLVTTQLSCVCKKRFFSCSSNAAGITLYFKQIALTVENYMPLKDVDGMANRTDPDLEQSDLDLGCLVAYLSENLRQ